ncbi:MAG: regulatory protein TetR [Actinomycetia bacterium]|nr:regulatory protein TetR [Actinomycetes bacterium]
MPVAEPLSRDRVLDAAMAIVEADGVAGLSMRALAAKLGVAVTAIYWHVGNKAELLAGLVERIGTQLGDIRTTGRTPEQRIVSTARSLLSSIDAHGALVGLAHQQGRLGLVFGPARAAIAEAFSDAGLRGVALVDATNAVIQVVAAYSLIEAVVSRSPVQRTADVRLWDGPAPIDRVAAERLHLSIDTERTFQASLVALVRGLLAPQASGGTKR